MAAFPLSPYVLVTTLCSSILSVTGSVDDCPPWFVLKNSSNSQCACSNPSESRIQCDQMKQMSYLHLGICAFQYSTTNSTVVATCPYVFPDHLIKDGRIPLPNRSSELNHFICRNLNREIEAPLCGRCTSGTGPSIYSAGSQCVRCSAVNIVYYLLLQYLPTTILFVVIIAFRISITSAPMAHYVLFCNALVFLFRLDIGECANLIYGSLHKGFSVIGNFFLILNSIWTLDFFYFASPPLCVSVHMEEIYIPFLDTVATLYPFILLLLTYVGIELHAHDFKPVVHLWRPFQRTYVRFRRTWDPNASVIQAFATLFFLSYTKFMLIMYEALLISLVINEEGNVVSRMSYIDPTVPILSHKHWYLISLSLVVLLLIILPPSLLLIIFPTCLYTKVSGYLKPRWIVSMQIFVDTFHGFYKDGTNGTRDYRAVSGYILVIWAFLPAVVIAAIAVSSSNHFLVIITFTIVFIAFSVLCALLRPYKHRIANTSGVVLPAVMASVLALSVLIPSNTHDNIPVIIVCCFLLTIPHCVFYGYTVYRLGKQYFCKIQEVEEHLNERLPCNTVNTSNYSQLIKVSP